MNHRLTLAALLTLCALNFGCSSTTTPDDAAGTDVSTDLGGDAVSADAPTDGPVGDGAACTSDMQCSNGRFCDGEERCVAGRCAAGTDPCDDHHSCTMDSCTEEGGRCEHRPDNSMCGDSNACNGIEVCDPGMPGSVSTTGCTPVRPDNQIDCDDRNTCTIDSCDVRLGCVHSPRDLDGDGHVDRQCNVDGTPTGMPGDDCNDSDPRVFPGAPENCTNGRDDNCNALIDFADTRACTPHNDTCGSAQRIDVTGPGTYRAMGSTMGLMPNFMPSCGRPTVGTAVYTFTLTAPQSVAVTTDDTGANAMIALLSTCMMGPELSCVRNASGFAPTLNSRMLAAGTYTLLVQTSTPRLYSLRLTVGMPTTPPEYDLCPAMGAMPAINLNDQMPHVVTFGGLLPDYSLSCDTGAPAPDAVYPLTLTGTRNVTVTATGVAGERVVLGLQRAPCGTTTSELRCSAFTATSTPGRVISRGLEAGTYYVIVKSANARDVTVQASLTDPTMRVPGDACPGVDVMPDGPAVMVTPSRFDVYADYGTTCGSASRPDGWTDWVYHFRLTTARDVTVTATGVGAGSLRMQLTTTCGAGGTATGPCVSGTTSLARRYRGLAAGDYYITMEGNPPPGSVSLQVATVAPGTRLPGDTCPGVDVVPDGSPGSITTGAFDTTSDLATTCGSVRPSDNWTDWVFHFRLSAPRDVTLNMLGTGVAMRMQLQNTCTPMGASIGGCVLGTSSVVRRYRGLAAGDYYVIGEASGLTAPAGPILLVVTTTAPSARVAGDVCMGAPTVTPDGPAVTLPTGAFDTTADYGTPCGSGTSPTTPFVDWNATYTLTSERDVTITTTASPTVQLFGVVETTCGMSSTAVGGMCVTNRGIGNMIQRIYRQPAGTYHIVGEARSSTPPASVNVTVTTAAPGSRPTYTRSAPTGVRYESVCGTPGAMSFYPSTDDGAMLVPMPFAFRYWGVNRAAGASVNVTTNGWIGLDGITNASYSNTAIPDPSPPNAMINALWDDLITGTDGVCVATVGTAPNRRFITEWRNTNYLGGGSGAFNFEIVLYETSNLIDLVYGTMGTIRGGDTTVGLENEDGSDGVAVCGPTTPSCVVASDTVIRFTPGM